MEKELDSVRDEKECLLETSMLPRSIDTAGIAREQPEAATC